MIGIALGIAVVFFLVPLIVVIMLTKQIISTNEKLMILVGTRDGGEKVGRALVASAREPKKNLPGVTKEPPQVKKDNPRPTGKPYSLKIGSK